AGLRHGCARGWLAAEGPRGRRDAHTSFNRARMDRSGGTGRLGADAALLGAVADGRGVWPPATRPRGRARHGIPHRTQPVTRTCPTDEHTRRLCQETLIPIGYDRSYLVFSRQARPRRGSVHGGETQV